MREYPIGSTLKLKVMPGDCDGCFFNELQRNIHDNVCHTIKCSILERSDNTNVKFVEIDDNEQ